jgi:hypothetical protein
MFGVGGVVKIYHAKQVDHEVVGVKKGHLVDR